MIRGIQTFKINVQSHQLHTVVLSWKSRFLIMCRIRVAKGINDWLSKFLFFCLGFRLFHQPLMHT